MIERKNETSIFFRWIGKSIVLTLAGRPSYNHYTEVVGVLVDYTKPWLVLSSYGNEQQIHEEGVRGIRKAKGDVKP
tara:strand:+ start:447 stop:674 length:228 start_codon:yes stop_codon:yes gene_type:complete